MIKTNFFEWITVQKHIADEISQNLFFFCFYFILFCSFFLLCFKTLQYYLKPWSLKLKKVISSDTGYLQFPEIDDANLKCTLWTFKRWLTLTLRVRYGISIVLKRPYGSFGIRSPETWNRTNYVTSFPSVSLAVYDVILYTNVSVVKDSFTAVLPWRRLELFSVSHTHCSLLLKSERKRVKFTWRLYFNSLLSVNIN